jgi:hypothetical protein
MKSETLRKLWEKLPENAIQRIIDATGKSKSTVYNILKGVHDGETVINEMIKIIEDKAIDDLKYITEAKSEAKAYHEAKAEAKRQKQQKKLEKMKKPEGLRAA